MDYKEKYNEALERAKAAYGTGAYDDATLEFLFPELKESEDERMINGLQGFLSAFGSDYFGTDGWQKFDDWLEKQKEPSINSEIPKESKQEWSEEDLEKEIDKVWNNGLSDELAGPHNNFDICARLARHFYKYKLGKEDKK